MARCRGGYAVTILINGHGILSFRDPHGIRPLCLGSRPGGGGVGVGGIIAAASGGEGGASGGGGVLTGRGGGSGKMDLGVASESSALTGLGFSLKRDVRAGEAVFLDAGTGSVSSRICSPQQQLQEKEEEEERQQQQEEEEGGDGRGGGGGRAVAGRSLTRFKPCLFEYVYMARPDSIIDGVPVSVCRYLSARGCVS